LFDNDEPGIKAAQKYKEKYGLDYVILPLEKDLSDSVKDHGVEAVRDKLFPLLKQAL
jgi:DNA primase